jgi:hypothetical protein
MKLVWLRDSVVIDVLPEPERGKDAISPIYLTVSIASICWFIVLGKRKEPVSFSPRRGIRLWSEITEQFGAIVYYAVAVAIIASRASSELADADVHAMRSLVPSEFRSKSTPFAAEVKSNPLPLTSIIIGDSPQLTYWHRMVSHVQVEAQLGGVLFMQGGGLVGVHDGPLGGHSPSLGPGAAKSRLLSI